MRNSIFSILIIGSLLFSCDLFTSDTHDFTNFIDFKTLFHSFETETQMHEFETVVLVNKADVNAFLSEFPSDNNNREQLLNVNFTDSLVVGVFVGSRPNTSYSVSIDSVMVSANSSLVYITEMGSAFGGRAITWPAHFVVINKANFNHRSVGFPFQRICKLEPCSWPVHNVPN